MPPATNTGTSSTNGRISWARTEVETGPIWPPASMPSITSASAPLRTSFLANASEGAKQTTLAPPALSRCIVSRGGRPPASTTWPTRWSRQASASCVELRVHDDQVDAERAVGERCRRRDLRRQQLRAHRAAGEHAEAAGVADRGDQVPLGHPGHGPAQDGELAAEEAPATLPERVDPRAWLRHRLSVPVQAVGRVQRAQRQLGVLLADQHADLDLGGRDRLDVDALGGQRGEHLVRDAGVAAHADARPPTPCTRRRRRRRAS